MNIKQRVEKLEKATKQDICLVCWLQDVPEEDWEEVSARHSLEYPGIVFLSDADMEL